MKRTHPVCDVPGCRARVEGRQRLCEPHFRALPGNIRNGIIGSMNGRRFKEWEMWRERAAEHLDRRAET